MKAEDACGMPRCRQPTSLIYYGRQLCWQHWTTLCDGGNTAEKILDALGLVRNSAGVVVEKGADDGRSQAEAPQGME